MSNPQFIESLKMAEESGADYSGVLCGRATWKDGMPIYATKAWRRWKTGFRPKA